MVICGLQKLTLLDYPGELACTIFTRGCHFRCPFCQNSGLVLNEKFDPAIDTQEVLNFLKSRKGKLDGVCVSGGEPTLQKDLKSFLKQIKELGYKVKLDTNGYEPDILADLISEGLIDMVAMDIKNCPKKYAITSGLQQIDMEKIYKSIHLILASPIEHEFRTTVSKQFHTEEDVLEIGKMIKGCKVYYLQNFRNSENVIAEGLEGFSKEELESFKKAMNKNDCPCELRGI